MFHRSKNDDKAAAAAETAKAVEIKPSAGPVAATEKPIALDMTKSGAPSRAAMKPLPNSPVSNISEDKAMADEQTKPQQSSASSRPLDIPGSTGSYQSQPARAGNSYSAPSTYSNTPSAGSTVGMGHNKAPQGRRLVIGEGITLSGEIEACEYLVVEGTVEAALKGASVMHIAESGNFYGTVEINEATVSGRFEGEMTVNGRLTITATGSVTGSITYKELAVEAGATLDGKLNPLGGSKAGSGKKSDRSSDRGGKTKSMASRNDNAAEGVELPFNGTTAAA